MNSKQRISVVTGGASGIGEACVREFAGQGDLVVVLDRDLSKAEAVAASVKGKAYAADVGDELAVDACAAMIERECGPVDVLVNCCRDHSGAGAAARTADADLGRCRSGRPARHLCGLSCVCAVA